MSNIISNFTSQVNFHRTILLLGIGLLPYLCIAQTNELKFSHLLPRDGLSQATVYYIIQDHIGFIWISTSEGLNKYDGKEFEIFLPDPDDQSSISHNYVRVIFEDSKKNLWLATPNGLDLYNRSSNNFTHIREDQNDPNSLPHNEVTDIIEDRQGNLWITTREENGIISKLNREDLTFTHYKNTAAPSSVNRILQLRNGIIWMVHGDRKVSSYDPLTGKFSLIDDDLPEDPLKIFQDSDDNVWIGLDNGGIRKYISDESYEMIQADPQDPDWLSNNVIWDIAEDKKGKIWFATDLGLNCYDKSTNSFISYKSDPFDQFSLSSNFLLSVYIDPQSRMWIGTSENGIDYNDPRSQRFKHIRSLVSRTQWLSNNTVWSFTEDKNKDMWVSTSYGLNRFNAEYSICESFYNIPDNPNSLSHNRVWCLLTSRFNDKVWLGTSAGLNEMSFTGDRTPTFRNWQKNENDPYSISSNSVRCILEDDDGTIWCGTSSDGLNKFDPLTERFEIFKVEDDNPESISNNRVRDILRSSDGKFWVATQSGLNIMNEEIGSFTRIFNDPQDSTSLSHNHVRNLYEDTGGRLWIGTDYGLNLMEDTSPPFTFRRFNTENGLPNNRIYGILEDDRGNIYISTNRGLSRIDHKTFEITNFTEEDGLQSMEFNQGAAYRSGSGYLYFGGINGFNRFDPDQLSSDTIPVQIVLTGFQVHYEDIEIDPNGKLPQNINVAEDIWLDPEDGMFSIEFSALKNTLNSKNEFAYRLTPFEKDWNYSGTKDQAVYTNIPPGKYTFEVIGSNNDGIWSSDPASVDIHIRPALWQSAWFRLLMMSIAIIVAYIIYRVRVYSLVRSKEVLEETVKERTRQITDQKESLENTLQELRSTQDQLIQQEKMATVGQMTAGIAHEINNPINYISSNTTALQLDFKDLNQLIANINDLDNETTIEQVKEIIKVRDSIDFPYLVEEMKTLIDGIENGTERTTEIIKSLRYISYSDKADKELINIHDPIDSALSILKNSYKEKIEIVKCYNKVPEVKAFPGQLNQVFINIIGNASQAIQEKGTITISTRHKENGIEISIKDDGPGMEEEVKNRIFEPFYTTKDIGKGTGLGLSISYGIIEAHKGKIRVESQPAAGTEFIISLPIDSND